MQSPEQPVLRVQSSLSEQDFPKVEQLLLRYPNTTVLFVDEPSVGFSNRLQLLLRSHPRPSRVIVTSPLKATKLALKSESTSFFNPVIAWFRELPIHNAQRHGNSHLVFAPFSQNKRNQMRVVC